MIYYKESCHTHQSESILWTFLPVKSLCTKSLFGDDTNNWIRIADEMNGVLLATKIVYTLQFTTLHTYNIQNKTAKLTITQTQ